MMPTPRSSPTSMPKPRPATSLKSNGIPGVEDRTRKHALNDPAPMASDAVCPTEAKHSPCKPSAYPCGGGAAVQLHLPWRVAAVPLDADATEPSNSHAAAGGGTNAMPTAECTTLDRWLGDKRSVRAVRQHPYQTTLTAGVGVTVHFTPPFTEYWFGSCHLCPDS